MRSMLWTIVNGAGKTRSMGYDFIDSGLFTCRNVHYRSKPDRYHRMNLFVKKSLSAFLVSLNLNHFCEHVQMFLQDTKNNLFRDLSFYSFLYSGKKESFLLYMRGKNDVFEFSDDYRDGYQAIVLTRTTGEEDFNSQNVIGRLCLSIMFTGNVNSFHRNSSEKILMSAVM